MVEHFCNRVWVDGPVGSCPDLSHQHRGAAAPDVSPYTDEHRSRLRIDGVATSGQVSAKGTVEHTDYWSGRVAARAKPAPIAVKLWDLPWVRDRFVYRGGRMFEKATGKEVTWSRKASSVDGKLSTPESRNGALTPRKPNGGQRKPPGSPTVTGTASRRIFPTLGVGIGSGGVLLTPTE